MNEPSRHGRPNGVSIIRGSLISLGVRLIDLPSRYGFHLLIAFALGVVETGNFYIVFSLLVALAGFGRLGIDQALTRQLAMDIASGRPGALRPTIRRALCQVLMASTTITVVLAASAVAFAHAILRKPDLSAPLALGALSLIPQNLGTALAGALAGLQRVGYSQMIYSWLWPTVFCVGALPLVMTGTLTVNNALILIAASFTAAALVGGFLLKRFLDAIPGTHARTQPFEDPHLLKPGLSFFTLELTKLLITSAPAIILGIVASAREAGLYALAWRIALVINLLISGVSSMASPRFAELHVRQDTSGLNRSAAQATGLVLCMALPAAACMLLFPEQLLRLFGPGYEEGASTLRILALGQIAAACFTATPEILAMTAHASSLYRINACSLAVLLIGLAVLSAPGGSIGAAAATSLAIAVNGAAASWAAYSLLGVFPLATIGRWLLSHLPQRPRTKRKGEDT